MTKPEVIYFDMDGVLANFEGHLRASGKKLPKDLSDVPDDVLWPAVTSIPNFWEDLPLMDGAKELVDFAVNNFDRVAILSAPSRHDNRSCIGKNVWLNKHFPTVKFERNFVRASNKYLFGAPNAVLIDDMEINCDQWDSNGGLSVHHYDCQTSLSFLKLLVTLK